MIKRNALVGARFFFALLTLTAIGVQFSIHLEHSFNPVNFFSYFTNLANIFVALVLIIGGARLAMRRTPTARDEIFRGAAVVAMTLVGIVYGILLSGEDLGSLLPWVNIIVHYLMPLVVVADWVIQPPKLRLAWRHIMLWLIFPAVYLAYSLIRGAATGWYAYPFLNPDKVGSYLGVAGYCVAIFATFLATGWLVVTLGNKLKRYRFK